LHAIHSFQFKEFKFTSKCCCPSSNGCTGKQNVLTLNWINKLILLSWSYKGGSSNNTIPVNNDQELKEALKNAAPGDEIVLADGTYDNSFSIYASGTQSQPITLRGSSNTILTNTRNNDICLLLASNYWILTGFTITGCRVNLLLENAKNNRIENLSVLSSEASGIRLRNASSGNVFQNIAVVSLTNHGSLTSNTFNNVTAQFVDVYWLNQ
jgi:parallel beta-helix repeat protein